MKAKKAMIPAGYRFNDNDEIEMSSARCSEFFGVSDWTMRDWGSKGAPQVGRGWWNPKAVNVWLGKGRPGEGEPESDAARKLKAEAKLKEEQALKAKFENEVMQSQYFPKDEVAREWARRCAEFKNGLTAAARVIGNSISDNDIRIEVEKLIAEVHYDVLDQYSRDGKYTPKVKGKK